MLDRRTLLKAALATSLAPAALFGRDARARDIVLARPDPTFGPAHNAGQRAEVYLIGGAATPNCALAQQPGDQYMLVGDTTTGLRDGQRTPFWVSRARDRFGAFVTIHPTNGMVTDEGCYLPGWWIGAIRSRAEGVLHPFLRAQHEIIVPWAIGSLFPKLGVDSARITLSGTSQGGVGALQHGLRHPERYALVWAHVPRFRITTCADFSRGAIYAAPPGTVMADDDKTLYTDYMDSIAFVTQKKPDGTYAHPLPPIFLDVGQQDGATTGYVDFQHFVRAVQARDDTLIVAAWANAGHGVTSAGQRIASTWNKGAFSTRSGYPLLTECSADTTDFAPLAITTPPTIGGINLDFGFDAVVDSPTGWQCRLWTMNPAGVTVNVRPGGVNRQYRVKEPRKRVVCPPPTPRHGTAATSGYAPNPVTVTFGRAR